MNLTEAVERAIEEPTLIDALTWICVWESERIIAYARNNPQWDTCFKFFLKEVTKAWEKKENLKQYQNLKESKVEIVEGSFGKSLYINDHRVARPKPWGGGITTVEFKAERAELLEAFGIQEAQKPADRKIFYLLVPDK